MAGSYDFNIEQGTTHARAFHLRDDNDDPVDLNGWSVRMDVRESRNRSATLVLDLTEANDRIRITDAANGEITILLESPTTTDLEPGTYSYDIELFDNASPENVIRLLQGTFTISGEVTAD